MQRLKLSQHFGCKLKLGLGNKTKNSEIEIEDASKYATLFCMSAFNFHTNEEDFCAAASKSRKHALLCTSFVINSVGESGKCRKGEKGLAEGVKHLVAALRL